MCADMAAVERHSLVCPGFDGVEQQGSEAWWLALERLASSVASRVSLQVDGVGEAVIDVGEATLDWFRGSDGNDPSHATGSVNASPNLSQAVGDVVSPLHAVGHDLLLRLADGADSLLDLSRRCGVGTRGDVQLEAVPRRIIEEHAHMFSQLQAMQHEIGVLKWHQFDAYAQPVQVIINNSATVNAVQQIENTVAPPRPPPQEARDPDCMRQWWRDFLSSPTNCFCLFAVMHLSMNVAHSCLTHQSHMAEMERKIDGSLLLRFPQLARQ